MTALVLVIGLSAVLAQISTGATLSWVSAALAGLSLLAIAVRPVSADEGSSSDRLLAAFGAPLVVALWMSHIARVPPPEVWQLPLCAAAAFALLVLLVGALAGYLTRSGQIENSSVTVPFVVDQPVKEATTPVAAKDVETTSSIGTNGAGDPYCNVSRKRLFVEGEGWIVRRVTTCY